MPACNRVNPERSRLIRLIHVARRDLHMDEDSYRVMLARISGDPGLASCSHLTVVQLRKVLNELKAKGFKIRTRKKAPGTAATQSRPLASDPQSRKIRSLWLELHDLGAVRDPSETALAHWAAKAIGVDALQWASTDEASRAIEMLKRWVNRTHNQREFDRTNSPLNTEAPDESQ